jgi:uncharacterized protein (DUF488 family)
MKARPIFYHQTSIKRSNPFTTSADRIKYVNALIIHRRCSFILNATTHDLFIFHDIKIDFVQNVLQDFFKIIFQMR